MSDPNDAAFCDSIASSFQSDAQEFCRRTGCSADGGAVRLTYFYTEYEINLPECSFVPEIPDFERRLVLHYLAGKGPAELSTEYATFQSLPNGMFYYGPFRKRSVGRLLPVFGEKLELFHTACSALNALKTTDGDYGASFQAFPRLNVIFALYEGDDEFPAEMKVLFPKHATDYLSLEDIAVLAGIITSRLLRAT